MTKPYGYVRADGKGIFIYGEHQFQNTQDAQLIPVYTATPQRTWVGLTNDDWNSTPYDTEFRAGAEWAEAKLKEKNT